jgi:sugar/nucleoside kinase (ribokinase family)
VILSVGEALVEIMRPRRGIPLDRPDTFAGPLASGAPAIFASVAARRGAPTALCAVVGDDPFGALLRQRLAGDGVDVGRVRAEAGAPTGCAFVAYADDGTRSFVFHVGAAARLVAADLGELPERAAWLHVSGSSLALAPSLADVVETASARVHAAGGRISLDPNMRPEALSPDLAERLVRIAGRAAVLLPSEGELAAFGLDDTAAPVVCTTLGAAGVRVRTGSHEETIAVPAVDEVDPTGAGDTFAAAFVVATLAGADPVEAAREAVEVAATGVAHLGPMEAPVASRRRGRA